MKNKKNFQVIINLSWLEFGTTIVSLRDINIYKNKIKQPTVQNLVRLHILAGLFTSIRDM
jgi:hypothetical protein